MMAAETKPTEQDAQIQEKTISSQTEDLKKKSGDADGGDVQVTLKNGVGNHMEDDEDVVQPSDGASVDEKPSESNEADCGIAVEEPLTESNEADSGTTEEKNDASNEADSGVEEEKPSSESIEADSGTMLDEAPCSEGNEADSGGAKEKSVVQEDDSMTGESVSSTDAVTSEKMEEAKTNGVEEKGKEKDEKKDNSLGSTVAKHYNEISPNTKDARKESRIYHLRNFNNWIKSVVISEYLEKIRRRKRVSEDINVLDLACGKGGDILKWQKGKVDHVIMVDIAAKSVDQCKERYTKLQKEQRNNRYYRERLFTAEFFAADCTKTKLNGLYRRKNIKLDMSSCQFAFHYSFESYEQADMMLKNLCENLRVGGYFIGTTPDAQKLVKHIKACKADSFGNSVFNIKPENKESFPLFGSKYMFYLEGVVDCPEFIVYLPLLEKMAAKYNMKLVWKKNFHEIFKEYERQHASLLAKMSALEQYPATTGQLAGGSESQYKSAKDYVDKKGNRRVGTLSADEWEVAGLYIAFAFEKVEPPREPSAKERDDRKRSRNRSEDRHHDRRKPSESTTPKRSRKDVEDDVYEIKDEVYEDDEKPEDKSKSEKSKSSSSSRSSSKHAHERSHDKSSRRRSDETKEKSDSSKTRKSETDKSKSSKEEKCEPGKMDSVQDDAKEAEGEATAEEKGEEISPTVKDSENDVETAEEVPVATPDTQDSEIVVPPEAISVEGEKEVESTTVTSTDVGETETATEDVQTEEPMEE